MSVKQWKQVITITVATTILVLLILAVVFLCLYDESSEDLDHVKEISTMVESGELDAQEVRSISRFFLNARKDKSDLDYQEEYKNLYVDNDFEFVTPEKKTCYLTFDDGPTEEITDSVLDTLKKYDVKATFFVINNDSTSAKRLYRRIINEGHTIAIHTNSHNYEKIYESVDAYLKDFNKIERHIENITGVKPEIFRFPGGSVNSYNIEIYSELIAEMLRRGYNYYDWDISSGDASGPYVSAGEIKRNVLSQADYDYKEIIVLMHDGRGHVNTAEALPDIIKGLKAQGYSFAALTKDVRPSSFGYF